MPPILDAAIGTVFVFLLFSLVIAALNELILSFFDQRAKFLHMGLLELLGESKSQLDKTVGEKAKRILSGGLLGKINLGPLTQSLCTHGLINAFSRSDKSAEDSPNYIPAGAFVTVLLDLISEPLDGGASASAGDPPRDPAEEMQNMQTLAKGIDAVIDSLQALPPDLKDQANIDDLRSKINAAQGNLSGLRDVAVEVTGFFSSTAGPGQTAAHIASSLAAMPEGKLKQSLNSLFTAAGQDVAKFKTAIEGWFNGAMDRVSGWYKRFAQRWMIFTGFILAAALNVDTLTIVRTLSENPNLARSVASQAETFANENRVPITAEQIAENRRIRNEAVVKAQAALDTAKAITPQIKENVESAAKVLADAEAQADPQKAFRDSVARLGNTGLPIGWGEEIRKKLDLPAKGPAFSKGSDFWNWLGDHPGALISMCFGWLLTAVAASLGAPFWFDLLGKIINVRAAGKPPGEKDVTSDPSRPRPANLDATPGTNAPAR